MVPSYNERGKIYFDLMQYHKSVSDFNEAIKLNPISDAYFGRAKSFLYLKDYASSIKDFTQVIEWTGNVADFFKPGSFYLRGYALMNNNQPKEACEDWRRAVNLGINEAQTYIDKNCK